MKIGREIIMYNEYDESKGANAMRQFSNMIKPTNLLYYRLDGLLADGLDWWVSGGSYMVIFPPTNLKFNPEPVGVRFYVDAQDSLKRSEECPDGMLLIKMNKMTRSIPANGSRMCQFFCTYVEDEGQFYFKPMAFLRNYSKKLTGRRALSFNNRIAVLNNPKKDSVGYKIVEKAKENDKFAKLCYIAGYSAASANPLYYTQNEFSKLFEDASKHISKYPAEMKLSFKILRNTLTRFGRSQYGHERV